MEVVKRHVGHEPSGETSMYDPFNQDGRPYNPMTTAGCLALCAILEPHREAEERLQTGLKLWREMSGTSQPRLSLAGFEKKRELCNSDAEVRLLPAPIYFKAPTNFESFIAMCRPPIFLHATGIAVTHDAAAARDPAEHKHRKDSGFLCNDALN